MKHVESESLLAKYPNIEEEVTKACPLCTPKPPLPKLAMLEPPSIGSDLTAAEYKLAQSEFERLHKAQQAYLAQLGREGTFRGRKP